MKKSLIFISIIFLFLAFTQKTKPTLYIIGDSTVKNGSGKGADLLWGWGSVISEHFDTTQIHIENHAIGGRSSRTFLTEGRWEKILANLKIVASPTFIADAKRISGVEDALKFANDHKGKPLNFEKRRILYLVASS